MLKLLFLSVHSSIPANDSSTLPTCSSSFFAAAICPPPAKIDSLQNNSATFHHQLFIYYWSSAHHFYYSKSLLLFFSTATQLSATSFCTLYVFFISSLSLPFLFSGILSFPRRPSPQAFIASFSWFAVPILICSSYNTQCGGRIFTGSIFLSSSCCFFFRATAPCPKSRVQVLFFSSHHLQQISTNAVSPSYCTICLSTQ